MRYNIVATVLAVASLFALPWKVYAESGFYGSARIGLVARNEGSDTLFRFTNWASRMGYAGEHELESGLTAFGKYEFGVDTDSGNNIDDIQTRKAYVGIKSNFGTLLVGQNYHTWYNVVIAPVDQPWIGSCNGCIVSRDTSSDSITDSDDPANPNNRYDRTANALSYLGEFGAISIGTSIYLENDSNSRDGEEDLDGIEVGGIFDIGAVKIGVGVQDLADESDPAIGIALSGTAPNFRYAVNVTNRGDATGVDFYANIASFYFDIGAVNDDLSDITSAGVTLGYTLNLGERTLMWFEGSFTDSGETLANDIATLRAAFKYDWN